MKYTRTDIGAIQQMYWGEEDSVEISLRDRQIAQHSIKTLSKWRAPQETLIAATIIPILVSGNCDRNKLLRSAGREAFDLAQRLLNWRLSLEPPNKIGSMRDPSWLSLALRRLYRQAYLDLPSMSFMLLLLANHDALLSSETELSPEMARQTQKIFIPLTEMLGFWSLYRRWVEKSYSTLFAKEYGEMRALLGSPEDYSRAALARLLAKRSELESVGSVTVNDRQWLARNKFLFDKAEAYLHLNEQLRKRFSDKGIKARAIPIRHYSGLSLRRVREGEAKEDVAARLSVRIVCRSLDDCYAALGVVHSLGKPVSLTSSLHFSDKIASPQANGYQAIHAAITYNGFKERTNGKEQPAGTITVEIRILTMGMWRLNEGGVTAPQSRLPEMRSKSHQWWNQLSALNRQLRENFGKNPPVTIQQYLREKEPSSDSQPLYVFTPRGEIVLLAQGSTPLDFAYHIHTEMGHHAIKVEVNGQTVHHSYPLRNGDIVHISYDPDFAGPDLSWLTFVATPLARSRISKGLKRLKYAHPERTSIEEQILKTLRRYKQEKGYDIVITTGCVDDFLSNMTQLYGLAGIDELYLKMNASGHAARLLADKLISAELSPGIVMPDGGPLAFPPHQVSLCQNCCPSPRDSIVGYKIPKKGLVIHCDEDNNCHRIANPSRRIALTWAAQENIDQNELLVYRITGYDRPGLLREVLEVVYKTPKAYLYKVKARAHQDRHADISMIVKADSFDRFAEIQRRLSAVAGVEITSAPPTPSEWMSFASIPSAQPRFSVASTFHNPYTAEEVYQRGMFYDREEPLRDLLAWLHEPLPTSVMILHGQRRVGKTSLVKYLIYEHLPQYRLIQPIFVDLQGLDEFEPRNITNYIVNKVYASIDQSIPPRLADEETGHWLNRALGEALKHHPRLLIVIDEFNVLIELEHAQKLNTVIYNNIRSVMNEQRSINWLLVVQDTHFLDPEMWLGAGMLFQRVHKLQVKHLDNSWARKLILEPARKCGITPQDENLLTKEMIRLTAGSPYLIHLLCREMVEKARREGKATITIEDLNVAADLVTHEGPCNFDHFIKNLVDRKKVVMAAVATVLNGVEHAEEQQVINLLHRKARRIEPEAVRKVLAGLAKEGLIAMWKAEPDGATMLSIHIGLFKRFISNYLNLDEAIKQWRAALSPRRKAARIEEPR
ncbi:MAG TPA: TGS domain-containing protein [Pyrinomonadaceae bacterium]